MFDFEGGVRLSHFDGRDPFEPFASSFCPNWRESGVQLTEKQVVLLMHDIYKGALIVRDIPNFGMQNFIHPGGYLI